MVYVSCVYNKFVFSLGAGHRRGEPDGESPLHAAGWTAQPLLVALAAGQVLGANNFCDDYPSEDDCSGKYEQTEKTLFLS